MQAEIIKKRICMFGNSLRFNSMAVLRQIIADDDSWINMNHNRRPHVKFNHLIYHLIYTSFNLKTLLRCSATFQVVQLSG